MDYVIGASSDWHLDLPGNLCKKVNGSFHVIGCKDQLSLERLEEINPRYVFFPHWSYIIEPKVYDNFECIIFHMTDVPFGRGGSPLQNLISRGIYDTKITALRCEGGIDAGPVYMKQPLSLYGSAQEIYMRAGRVIEDMIVSIVQEEPKPVPQSGEVIEFPRRKPAESDIAKISNLDQVFDYIRMLDADNYPKAFFETAQLRFEFSRASRKINHVVADVRITLKDGNEK
ncbi:MAG: methionyl-tRNA formyltransferase [Candidatus Electrothrix sp. AW2]|nr:methionyl-tRNA formyltransferase [Candidatus Electrothrix gigas]